jgi:hypothetical protein
LFEQVQRLLARKHWEMREESKHTNLCQQPSQAYMQSSIGVRRPPMTSDKSFYITADEKTS